MSYEVITVGGGLAGSTLATALARAGRKVLILERETQFKDRVRGENMVPWGVAAARRLGLVDDLVAAGGHQPRVLDHLHVRQSDDESRSARHDAARRGLDECLSPQHAGKRLLETRAREAESR